MTATVRRLLHEDGLRKEMGLAARRSAEGRDWEASTQTLRGYYGEAIDR
jgi:hypothetical protein